MQRALPLWLLSLVFLCHVFVPSEGHARVTRVVIEQIESPTFAGQAFGAAGHDVNVVPIQAGKGSA